MQRYARLSFVLLAFATGALSAQPVYRQVAPNGKVTFSDQPPAANARPAAVPAAPATAESGGATAALPYELQQVVQRYPVTIYTRDDCAPCDAGRSLLSTRGVPFNERQVKTPEDGDALMRLSGQNALPLLTIGAQQLKGFSDGEWSQYLDAAGYPKSIRLPVGYRNAPAQPMVAQRSAPAAVPSTAAGTAVPPPRTALPDGPTPSNPAGIKF
jgi:glutaredoxin